MKEEKKTKAEAGVKKTPKNSQMKEKIVDTKKEKRIGTRGRIFEGIVIKKFKKRIVIELERMIEVRKYRRYIKLKTKIHARLPETLEKEINLGDLVSIRECRPLSKIIHFITIKKIKDAAEVGK